MNRINIKLISICFVIIISLFITSCAQSENSVVNASEVSTASGSTGDTVQPTTASVSGRKTENEKTKTLVIAHRGFSGQYPESTIQAFKAAFNSGFDAIECDVWEAYNGDLMIQHDPTTTRTTGKKQYIWKVTSKTRKKYPIVKGDNVEKFNSTKLIIPTLTQVLKITRKNNGFLWLHIKNIKNDKKYRLSKKGEKKIIRMLKKYKLLKRTLIFGGKKYVAPFLNKGLKTGLFTAPKNKKQAIEAIKWCKKKHVTTIVFSNMKKLKLFSNRKRLSKVLKKKKIKFGVYRVDTHKQYRYLCRIGARFAMSNYDIR